MMMAVHFNEKDYLNDKTWIDIEVESSQFKDQRLHKRFKNLVGQMWAGIGGDFTAKRTPISLQVERSFRF